MQKAAINLELGLAAYLTKIRSLVIPASPTSQGSASSSSKPPRFSFILGNPSCDLDSFISAYLLSYFYNNKDATKGHSVWIPLLNLPDVPAGDLWRLRPEFGAALSFAINDRHSKRPDVGEGESPPSNQNRSKTLLEQLVTIHDLQHNQSAVPSLREAFRASKRTENDQHDVILVDHNALVIPGLDESSTRSHFNIVGCIDHHVDEDSVKRSASPRIITTGIGSCTSLVVKHLRENDMWREEEQQGSDSGEEQIARLAMASILIDTTNLTAEGDKCSDTDRDAINFLQQCAGESFNRDELFEQTARAKDESLNLLTMSEIFARDYKEWTEPASASGLHETTIGISSLVKPLAWLSEHAGSTEALVDEMLTYARAGEKQIEVLCLLTRAGNSKEVVVISFGEQGRKGVELFEESAAELQLQEWNEDANLTKMLDSRISDRLHGCWRIWWMGDVSKSRKQVAPLLRAAIRSAK